MQRMMAALRRPGTGQARPAAGARQTRAQPRRGVPAGRLSSLRPAGLQQRPGFQFFGEAVAELKKVTWPTRRQAQNLTLVVIAVSFAVGLVLGGMDYIFSKLFEAILRLG